MGEEVPCSSSRQGLRQPYHLSIRRVLHSIAILQLIFPGCGQIEAPGEQFQFGALGGLRLDGLRLHFDALVLGDRELVAEQDIAREGGVIMDGDAIGVCDAPQVALEQRALLDGALDLFAFDLERVINAQEDLELLARGRHFELRRAHIFAAQEDAAGAGEQDAFAGIGDSGA